MEAIAHQGVSTAHPPKSFRIFATTPEGDEETKSVAVTAETCEALLVAAARQLEAPFGDAAVVFCVEVTYEQEGAWKRALRCFDETKEWNYFDIEDGSVVGSWRRYYRRFLAPSSPLPYSPNRETLIFVRGNTEIITVNSQRHLEAAPADALWDRAFVLHIWGVRRGARLYWQVESGFIDSVTGEIFSQLKIPEGDPKRHVILLLRDGDCVPHIAVPRCETSFCFKRADLSVRMESGCVSCTASQQPMADTHLWDEVDEDFCYNFGAAARK